MGFSNWRLISMFVDSGQRGKGVRQSLPHGASTWLALALAVGLGHPLAAGSGHDVASLPVSWGEVPRLAEASQVGRVARVLVRRFQRVCLSLRRKAVSGLMADLVAEETWPVR